MKKCPVCNAVAFDDALICYGCMHRFDDDDEMLVEDPVPASSAVSLQEEAPHAHPHAGPNPEFLIRFTPVSDGADAVTWSCAVEIAS